MLKTLDGSIISLIILIIIFVQIYDQSKKTNAQSRLFFKMVCLNIVLIVLDLLTWHFDGKAGRANLAGAKIANILFFSLQPIMASLFVLYIADLIKSSYKRIVSLKIIIAILLTAIAVLTVASSFTGWFFNISENNIYTRGEYFILYEIGSLSLFVYSFYLIIRNRKIFERKYFIALIIFFIPQAAGIAIQSVFYGYTTIMIGMTLSILIIYISIQSRSLNTDYLTELNNRRSLDEYVSGKIKSSTDKDTFIAVMIDIDSFKSINDSFGHELGDLALKDTARILKDSLRRGDFISRMGGDEFIVIIDVHQGQLPDAAVTRIMANLDKFNAGNSRPYQLSVSIGYYMFEPASKMTSKELLRHIDKLMYDNKKSKTDSISALQ